MRLAVIGAGACGGYYGAQLARAGTDVTFIARPSQTATIERRGIRVQSVHGDFEQRVQVTADPRSIGPVDVVLVAVKGYDLERALEAVAPMVGERSLVWCVQNGVDAPALAAQRYGRARVIAGALRIEAVLFAPGRIGHLSPFASASMAPWERGADERDEALLTALRAAGIKADLHPDARHMLWLKLLSICPTASLTTVTRAPLGAVLSCPESRAMFTEAIREVVAVAAAIGVDLGGEEAVGRTLAIHDGLPPTMRTSMQRDIEAGRRIELEGITGAVVRYGRERGVPTPVHAFLYSTLRPYAIAADEGFRTGDLRRPLFGEYLVKVGQISDAQLRTVLGLQTLERVRGGRLRIGDALEELGVLSREAIEQLSDDFEALLLQRAPGVPSR